MSKSRYDTGMIRDFLDHSRLEYWLSFAQRLIPPGPDELGAAEQVRRYVEQYGTGLVAARLVSVLAGGKEAWPDVVQEDIDRAMDERVRWYYTCLKFLRPLFEYFLLCADHRGQACHLMKVFPPPVDIDIGRKLDALLIPPPPDPSVLAAWASLPP